MIITGNSLLRLSPVGVVRGETVYGDWGTCHLSDAPKGAVLFALDHDSVFEVIRRGNGRAKYWRKRYVAYEIYGRTIKNAKDIFTNASPEEAVAALVEFRNFLWENNANLSSLSGSANSLWRGTLSEGQKLMVASGRLPMPVDRLFLGGRQDATRGVYEEASLWDISGAYVSVMRDLMTGAHYREVPKTYVKATTRDLSLVGFAHARVAVKKSHWGPLPIRTKRGVTFPRSGNVEGVYDFTELLAAHRIGLSVSIERAWIGRGLRFPWRKWARTVEEGRALSPIASRLVKASANSLWGSFAISGSGKWISYPDGGKMLVELTPVAYTRKNSQILSAHVASTLRARLYLEALHFNHEHVVACHTDGAIFLPGAHPLYRENGNGLGSWSERKKLNDLTLLSASVYRYVNEAGEERYSMPGTPTPYRKQAFRHLITPRVKQSSKLVIEGGF